MASHATTTHKPRVVSDLSTSQLRTYLLSKLHPTIGVNAFGATRKELLEMADENELYVLSAMDIEDLGPEVPPASLSNVAKDIEGRIKRGKHVRAQGRDAATWKLWAQTVVVVVIFLVRSDSFGFKQTLANWGLATPPPPKLPFCPPPRWWQRPLPPWLKPGAKGECRVRKPRSKQQSRARLEDMDRW